MKNLFAALLFALFAPLVCPSCSHVQVPLVSTVKECANDTTASIAAGIKTNVSDALICEANNIDALPACVKSQLIAIAKIHGWPAVDCVIWKIETGETSTTVTTTEKAATVNPDLRLKRAQAAATWRANTNDSSG